VAVAFTVDVLSSLPIDRLIRRDIENLI